MLRPKLPAGGHPRIDCLFLSWSGLQIDLLAPQTRLCLPVGAGVGASLSPAMSQGGGGGTQVKREPGKGLLPFELKKKKGEILLVKSEYSRMKPPLLLLS